MNLSELEHLQQQKQIRFKTETVDNELFTIACYMVASTDLWNITNAIECRGITFNTSGQCVSRPFEKFFSVGETPQTQLGQIRGKVCEVFEKRDGSLVHPVLVNNRVWLKTKKSFYSDVAVLANARMPTSVEAFCKKLCKLGLTPMFEFTCDEYPVVIDYHGQQPFTLLAVRNIQTGQYLSWNELTNAAAAFKIPTVEKYDLSLDQVISNASSLKNIEGYVLILDNGSRVKLKTAWYLANHRLKTVIRERDIAEMVVDELVDDIKILVSSENLDLAPILDIERKVVNELINIEQSVLAIVRNCQQQHKDQKSLALEFKDHKYFGLIMREFSGRPADYIKYWKRNCLANYSLKCVYNENF